MNTDRINAKKSFEVSKQNYELTLYKDGVIVFISHPIGYDDRPDPAWMDKNEVISLYRALGKLLGEEVEEIDERVEKIKSTSWKESV